MTYRIICLALAMAFDNAAAQQPTIEIKSARYDQRREDTAAMLVLDRATLAANGDRSLSEALRRLPGVTVTEGNGRGVEIRLRGLGSGYTQLLLNGVPAPAGFALDALAPDLIERIEVVRNASAEHGAQSVAGTINIILRKNSRREQQEFRLGWERINGTDSPSIAGQRTGKAPGWSYSVGANLVRSGRPEDRTVRDTVRDAHGAITGARTSLVHESNVGDALNLTPHIDWSPDNGDSINVQNFINLFRRRIEFAGDDTVLAGAAGDFSQAASLLRTRSLLLRSDWSWQHALADGKLELKLSGTHNPRSSAFDFTGANAAGPAIVRHVSSDIRETGLTHKGKYARQLAGGHSLVLGWDGATVRRRQTRDELERDGSGAIRSTSGESYHGTIRRLAGFVQDEWEFNAEVLSLGLRWETLRTSVGGSNSAALTEQDSRVLSPVLQWLHKLPSGSQWRLGVSRTYKAPIMLDLIPRRYTIDNNNSPTTPDLRGNPQLRPELAWGLDAVYDHHLGKDATLSASLFARRIDDVVLQRVGLEAGRWVAVNGNHGHADVYGFALEAQLALTPALRMRSNLALNRSRTSSVPGPYNRLASQIPLSANLSLDYRRQGLTLGGDFNFQAGGDSRASANRLATASHERKLDLRAAWQLHPGRTLRLTLANLLRQDRINVARYEDADGWRQTRTDAGTHTLLRLAFEANF